MNDKQTRIIVSIQRSPDFHFSFIAASDFKVAKATNSTKVLFLQKKIVVRGTLKRSKKMNDPNLNSTEHFCC